MQIPWRRAGALSGTVSRLVVMSAVAALLIAGAAVPGFGLAGIAARDVANTFDTLPVGTVGPPPSRSVIYTSDGRVITYLYPNHIYRVPVGYSQIAPVMRDAIVAIEDSSFFQQGALDPRGTLRALLHNSSGGQLQGASTLAQQYVKNVRVLQAQTPAEVQAAIYPNLQRKIQQLRLAADVEHEMTPDQLLAAYLNVAFFGEQRLRHRGRVPGLLQRLGLAADAAGSSAARWPCAVADDIRPVYEPGQRPAATDRGAGAHVAAALHL